MEKYGKFDLDNMKMGHIMLVRRERDDRLFGYQIYNQQKAVGFIEPHAHYTHVEVLGGGPYSVRVAPPKTKVIDIREVYPGRYVKVVKHKAPDYNVKRYKVALWAATHCNLPYDFKGIIRFKAEKIPFINRFIDHSKNTFFCSESVLTALQKEYPKVLKEVDPHECYPAAFLMPQYFEVVWEGYIPHKYDEYPGR